MCIFCVSFRSSREGSPRHGRRGLRDKSPEKSQDLIESTAGLSASTPSLSESRQIKDQSEAPHSFMEGLKSKQALRLQKQKGDLGMEDDKKQQQEISQIDKQRQLQQQQQGQQQVQQHMQHQIQHQNTQMEQQLQQGQQIQRQLQTQHQNIQMQQQLQQGQQIQQQLQTQHQNPQMQQQQLSQKQMQQPSIQVSIAAEIPLINQNLATKSTTQPVSEQLKSPTNESILANNNMTSHATSSMVTHQPPVYYSTPLSSQSQQSMIQKAQLENEVQHLMKRLYEMENTSQKHELDATSHLAQLEAKVRFTQCVIVIIIVKFITGPSSLVYISVP